VAVAMIPRATLYNPRQSQMDFRLAKNFRIRSRRVQAMLDLYNAFNSSEVLTYSNTYGATTGALTGSAWLIPTSIIAPRIVKFGVQASF
jgi:hypothetical protein